MRAQMFCLGTAAASAPSSSSSLIRFSASARSAATFLSLHVEGMAFWLFWLAVNRTCAHVPKYEIFCRGSQDMAPTSCGIPAPLTSRMHVQSVDNEGALQKLAEAWTLQQVCRPANLSSQKGDTLLTSTSVSVMSSMYLQGEARTHPGFCQSHAWTLLKTCQFGPDRCGPNVVGWEHTLVLCYQLDLT